MVNELKMAEHEDELRLQLLQYHGAHTLTTYAKEHLQYLLKDEIEKFKQKVMKVEPLNDKVSELPEESKELFGKFVGFILPSLANDINENSFKFPEDEAKENELYGIIPPMEYFLGIDEVTRKKMFYKALEQFDILLGEVVDICLEDEYCIRLICCQNRRCMIDDLDLTMYLKKKDCEGRVIKVGDFVRGIFYAADNISKKFYLNFDYSYVESKITLGLITQKDFPMYYKLMREAPVKNFDLVLDETIEKRNLHLEAAFIINPKNIYSNRKNVRNSQFPPEEKLLELHKNRKTQLCEMWLHRAREYYQKENIAKTLFALEKCLEFDPNCVNGLLDRVAVYGNILCYSLAIVDLEKLLKLDVQHERVMDYYQQILTSQADDLVGGNNYKAIFKVYRKLLQIPAFKEDIATCKQIILAAFRHSLYYPREYEEVIEAHPPPLEASDDSDSITEIPIDRKEAVAHDNSTQQIDDTNRRNALEAPDNSTQQIDDTNRSNALEAPYNKTPVCTALNDTSMTKIPVEQEKAKQPVQLSECHEKRDFVCSTSHDTNQLPKKDQNPSKSSERNTDISLKSRAKSKEIRRAKSDEKSYSDSSSSHDSPKNKGRNPYKRGEYKSSKRSDRQHRDYDYSRNKKHKRYSRDNSSSPCCSSGRKRHHSQCNYRSYKKRSTSKSDESERKKRRSCSRESGELSSHSSDLEQRRSRPRFIFRPAYRILKDIVNESKRERKSKKKNYP